MKPDILCFLVIWGGRGFRERLNNFVFFGFNQFWDDPYKMASPAINPYVENDYYTMSFKKISP
jgi:hypothetical protein